MKSRILKVKDYREVDAGPLLKPFVPDEAALEAELRRLTNPYIRWKPGEAVSAGDQVVCRLSSDCPRYNKEKVRFVAGSGMFQAVFQDTGGHCGGDPLPEHCQAQHHREPGAGGGVWHHRRAHRPLLQGRASGGEPCGRYAAPGGEGCYRPAYVCVKPDRLSGFSGKIDIGPFFDNPNML